MNVVKLKNKIMQARLIFILTAYFVFSTMGFGQSQKDIKKVCGTYDFEIPDNLSIAQAKQIALTEAKIEAVRKEFGEYVTLSIVGGQKNENGKSDEFYQTFGGSEGKAEWLEDIKGPEYKTYYDDKNRHFISVSICGKAREITKADIDFSAKILRNGTEAKFEDNRFKHKDDFYLMFRSPVDGFLTVYLYVIDENKVYCLLPYMNEGSGTRKIKGGKDYLFFSEKHAEPLEANTVTEYILTCTKEIEQNIIYIIFTSNKFTKANDYKAENETKLPPELPFEDFQKWLINNQIKDKDMKVEKKSITITK
jgi:hypothetical protein